MYKKQLLVHLIHPVVKPYMFYDVEYSGKLENQLENARSLL